MSITVEPQTARKYFERTHAQPGTPSSETTPSYISTDWVADRAWQRAVAGIHEQDARDARARAGIATAHVRLGHGARLATEAQQDMRNDPQEILRSLAVHHGYTWIDIARMIGVSVPAIRKWRMGGRVTSENTAELAYLSAFTRMLDRQGVRAASWMSIPMVPGFTVAPKHLYSREHAAKLLDLAAGAESPQDILNELDPEWRVRYDSRGYKVVRFEDGSYGTASRAE